MCLRVCVSDEFPDLTVCVGCVGVCAGGLEGQIVVALCQGAGFADDASCNCM